MSAFSIERALDEPGLQKTLFISGASRGIGLAIGVRAAPTAPNVVVAAKTVEPHPKLPGTITRQRRELRSPAGHALAVQCDVRSEDDITRAVALAVERSAGSTLWSTTASAIRLGGLAQVDAKGLT